MKRLAIIGYPISHSLSPTIYNAAFPAMDFDATFEAWATSLRRRTALRQGRRTSH